MEVEERQMELAGSLSEAGVVNHFLSYVPRATADLVHVRWVRPYCSIFLGHELIWNCLQCLIVLIFMINYELLLLFPSELANIHMEHETRCRTMYVDAYM